LNQGEQNLPTPLRPFLSYPALLPFLGPLCSLSTEVEKLILEVWYLTPHSLETGHCGLAQLQSFDTRHNFIAQDDQGSRSSPPAPRRSGECVLHPPTAHP